MERIPKKKNQFKTVNVKAILKLFILWLLNTTSTTKYKIQESVVLKKKEYSIQGRL